MTRDYADYMFDCQELRWAAEDEAHFAAKQAAARAAFTAERCEDCGYLLTALGHHYSCDTPEAQAERRAVLARQGR